MKNLLITFLTTATLLASAPVWSAIGDTTELPFHTTKKLVNGEKQDDPYFEIEKITVTEIETEEYFNDEKFDGNKDLGSIILSIEKLIALGTKIYDIIKKGKPVTNLSFAKPVSVLPQTEDPNTAFTQMAGWSMPTAKTYRVEYKNLFGMSVIAFDYTVYFQHSGTYEDKGSYITGLTVRATNISVSWGFEFNASSALETISNMGTRVDPKAAATMRINYQASSILSDIQSSESFFATGTGEIVKF